MKVAVVHDDLTQWGGAERVLLGISELFPEAPIYTLVFDNSQPILAEKFRDKKIIPSFLQKLPRWKSYFKATLPLQPLAFEQFDFSDFDLVISQTTRFTKSIITKDKTLHICYCHTPPRFLWNFSSETTSKFLLPFLSFLRVYDRVSSQRPDIFLAGSKNAQKRIKRVYQKESEVLVPYIELNVNQEFEAFNGDYYLVIARLNKYKRVDLAIDVCRKLKVKLKVVGKGPLLGEFQKIADKNIEILGGVSEELLFSLLAGCKGLIVTAEEDFGLTPLEAQSFGKGVIAYGVGGAKETVIDDKTGILFNEQSTDSLQSALEKFEKMEIDPKDCREQAEKFSKKRFLENLTQIVKQAKRM
jgi:glycosyltransferase involved in cell wall biosynthesis